MEMFTEFLECLKGITCIRVPKELKPNEFGTMIKLPGGEGPKVPGLLALVKYLCFDLHSTFSADSVFQLTLCSMQAFSKRSLSAEVGLVWNTMSVEINIKFLVKKTLFFLS